MRRRYFLGSAGATTMLATAAGCSGPGGDGAPGATGGTRDTAADRVTTLAGRTLGELREEYRHWLFDDYIPFHDRWVVDHEYGGYHLTTGWNGPTLDYGKSLWYQGRGLWTYSFLYGKVEENPDHLEAAKGAADLLLRNRPDGDALWPASFTREGTPSAPPSSSIYGDLFAANGLSEYAKASGDGSCREAARETLMKCMRIYDRPGYDPAAPRTYLGEEGPLMPGGARTIGYWFVTLRLCSQMLETGPDPDVEAVADRCVEAVFDHHHNPDFDLMNEVLNHDLSRPDNVCSQLCYAGHAIESLWMIMCEAVRRGDAGMFDTAAGHFRRHLEVAWDDVYDGLFRNLRNVDENRWDVDKAGWVQAEALIGLLCIIEHRGDAWARDFLGRLYPWVVAKYPLEQYGYPLWLDYADRRVTFSGGTGSRRAENFHHPRHLMLNLLALDRIIGRDGAPSGIVG